MAHPYTQDDTQRLTLAMIDDFACLATAREAVNAAAEILQAAIETGQIIRAEGRDFFTAPEVYERCGA